MVASSPLSSSDSVNSPSGTSYATNAATQIGYGGAMIFSPGSGASSSSTSESGVGIASDIFTNSAVGSDDGLSRSPCKRKRGPTLLPHEAFAVKTRRKETQKITSEWRRQWRQQTGITPKKRAPGGGKKCKFPDIEEELYGLIARNEPCRLLGSDGTAASDDTFLWDARSIALSFSLRIQEKYGAGTYHYSQKHPFTFVSRYIKKWRLEWLSANALGRYGGMNVAETRRRVCCSMIDMIRKKRELETHFPIAWCWIDETSVSLQPEQSGRYYGKVNNIKTMPEKGSRRYVSALVGVSSCGFKVPTCFNLGEKTTTRFEKTLIGRMYGVPLPPNFGQKTRAKQYGKLQSNGQFCIAYDGNTNGSTHLDQALFLFYCKELGAQWVNQRTRHFPGHHHAKLIVCMDNASAHKLGDGDQEELNRRFDLVFFFIRSRLTSWLCLCDTHLFSNLKRLVDRSWRSQVISLLHIDVYSWFVDVQQEITEDTFEKYGVPVTCVLVPYAILGSRLQGLIPEEVYTAWTTPINWTVMHQSTRTLERNARGLGVRRAVSAHTSGELNWQRAVTVTGGRMGRQQVLLRRMYGLTQRSWSAGADVDNDDFEIL